MTDKEFELLLFIAGWWDGTPNDSTPWFIRGDARITIENKKSNEQYQYIKNVGIADCFRTSTPEKLLEYIGDAL